MLNLIKKTSIILLVVVSTFVILSNFIEKSKDFKIEERYNVLKYVVDAKISVINDKEHICRFFEHLDTIEHVFAAVYDENFNCLTNRHPDVYPDKIIMFNPLEHEHIVNHIQENESGELECDFNVISNKNKTYSLYTLVYYIKVYFDDGYITCMISTPYVNDYVKMGDDYLRVFLITIVLMIVIVGAILTFSLVKN